MALLNGLTLPHGWPWFQNPITHIRSYFFSDLARLIMIGPAIIYQLEEKDFSSKALKCMHLEMGLRSKAQVLDEILLCWTTLADASVVIFSAEINHGTLKTKVLDLAKQLIKVCHVLLSYFCLAVLT